MSSFWNEQDSTLFSGYVDAEGLRQGEWTTIHSNTGDTISNFSFVNDTLNGPFFNIQDQRYSESKWLSSQPYNYSVTGTETLRVEGTMKDGCLHGMYNSFFSNGQLYYSGVYELGKKEGTFTTYFKNGNLALMENFTENILDGEWMQYYNSEKLREKRNYQLGELLSSTTFEWYDNGNPMNSSPYQYFEGEKLRHGIGYSYFESGKIELQSEYSEGRATGLWLGYYETGVLKFEMKYSDFKLERYNQFGPNGDLLTD